MIADVSHRFRFLAFAAVCLLLLQTLPYLSARWVEDESWYGAVGYTYFHEGELRNPTFPPMDRDSVADMRPPLTALTAGSALRLFGMGPAQARVPFLLAGAGAVVVVFFIGLELAGPWVGALAALLLATDNLLFLVSRTVRPDVLVVFWGSLGVLLYLRSKRTNASLLALGSGLAIGVSLDAHPNGLAALAAVGLFLLAEFGWKLPLRRRFWALALGVAIATGPFIYRLTSPRYREATVEMYTTGQGPKLKDIPTIERKRYADFLGFAATRKAGIAAIPYRIHIGIAILIAFWVLFRVKRRLFWTILALIAPCVLLWAWQRHPTTRYMAVASPWFALLLAAAAVRLGEANSRLRMPALAALALIGVSQFGGNAFLLNGFRKAEYPEVTRKLRAVIPPGAGVYGAITFWLSLYDHPYASWNRTPLQYAVSNERVAYLILNDRVLLNGSGFGEDDWAAVRAETQEFVKHGATLVAHVDDPFYGDLEVYRVTQ